MFRKTIIFGLILNFCIDVAISGTIQFATDRADHLL